MIVEVYWVYIRFGKIGTKGQAEVKSFKDTEEALAMKQILITEQKTLGYQE